MWFEKEASERGQKPGRERPGWDTAGEGEGAQTYVNRRAVEAEGFKQGLLHSDHRSLTSNSYHNLVATFPLLPGFLCLLQQASCTLPSPPQNDSDCRHFKISKRHI